MSNSSPTRQSEYIWWKHGVFYQIYPRSFMDSSGDGVGDLGGIIAKLDYLEELGVDAIWISPIYPSPMADFGYDVSDYNNIHPLFGDLETFDRLLIEAHRREIRVVLDYVPNHSSDEHPWFVESRSSRHNPKRDWYIWRDPLPDGGPPNNWESFFGGSAWNFDSTTSQYYLHLFLEKQPDLNWRNPAVIEAMHNVLRFWLDRGVDGFRMDVVTFLMKHPDMPDNPPIVQNQFGTDIGQQHIYDINQPEIHQHLREFRQLFDSYPGERVTIGETWFMDPSELATYYGANLDELHLPFNFLTLKESWQAKTMKNTLKAYYDALPEGATPNFVFGNHDTHRLATRYGYENHRSVGMLLLTLRGAPTMYYGDELGMLDVYIPPEALQDPVALRKPDSNDGRDPERTPMPWNERPNAGFCPPEAAPWLPIPDNYKRINVAGQARDHDSTLNFYRRLLQIRRKSTALQFGEISFLDVSSSDVLAYTRCAPKEDILVIINFAPSEQAVQGSIQSKMGELLLSTLGREPGDISLEGIQLAAHESMLILLK